VISHLEDAAVALLVAAASVGAPVLVPLLGLS
jgi:hypothetical protein